MKRKWLMISILAVSVAAVWLGQRSALRWTAAQAREAALLEQLGLRVQMAELVPRLELVRRERDELTVKLGVVQAQADELEAAQVPLRQTVERLSGERLAQGARLDEQTGHVAGLERSLDAAQRQIEALKTECARLIVEVQDGQALVADTRKELSDRESTAEFLRREAASAAQRIKAREEELSTVRGKLAASESTANGLRKQVADLTAIKDRQETELVTLRQTIERQVDEIRQRTPAIPTAIP